MVLMQKAAAEALEGELVLADEGACITTGLGVKLPKRPGRSICGETRVDPIVALHCIVEVITKTQREE
ncbi:hypothetical protein ACFX2A_040565 [Malus domestica]